MLHSWPGTKHALCVYVPKQAAGVKLIYAKTRTQIPGFNGQNHPKQLPPEVVPKNPDVEGSSLSTARHSGLYCVLSGEAIYTCFLLLPPSISNDAGVPLGMQSLTRAGANDTSHSNIPGTCWDQRSLRHDSYVNYLITGKLVHPNSFECRTSVFVRTHTQTLTYSQSSRIAVFLV